MSEFMVISSFKSGTDMSEVLSVVEDEKAKVKELQDAGRLGQIFLAVPQGKVFLRVDADSPEAAAASVSELPMARWWNLEVFALSGQA